MLKVVGASWFKTRVSTYILLGAICLAVSAFFIADMERPQLDNTYCATAFWSKNSGFRLEFWGQQNDLQIISKGCARACFKDTIFENGWAKLEIETQPDYPDQIQAYGAGILEGALTWSYIYSHWSNTIQSFCDENDANGEFCDWLRNIFTKNYNSTIEDSEHHKLSNGNINQDHYWHQIRLFYYQLEGIEFGFRKGVKRSRSDYEIEFEDFLLMNSIADLKDMKFYYDNFIVMDRNDDKDNNENDVKNFINYYDDPKSMVLLKILNQNDGVQILLGQSSAGSYSTMIRMLKRYRLGYHVSSDMRSALCPGNEIILTGYPGTISSMDDFYIITGRHNRLIVTGMEMKYNNSTMWDEINYRQNSVFLSARVMTANRLSTSGRSWARIMARHPDSGSKQWVVLDAKRLHSINMEYNRPSSSSSEEDMLSIQNSNTTIKNSTEMIALSKINYHKGTVWVVDQIPGRLHGQDVTNEIFKNGHWNSHGIPYFNETFEISGLSTNNLDNDEGKLISKKLENVTGLDSMLKLLKRIAYRGDLISGEKRCAYGNIDAKLFLENNFAESIFQTISGPLYHQEEIDESSEKISSIPIMSSSSAFQSSSADNNEMENEKQFKNSRKFIIREELSKNEKRKVYPFRWSNSNLDVDHFGQPDLWNFDVYSPKWAWSNF